MNNQRFFVFLAVLFFFACAPEEKNTVEVYSNVKTKLVESETRQRALNYAGFVSADSLIEIGFKLSGKIDRVFVSNGSEIKAGDVLLELEDRDYSLDLEHAELLYSQAVETFKEAEEYYKKLESSFNQGGISKADFDKVLLDYQVKKIDKQKAILNLELKQRQMEYTVLKSSMNGRVIDVPVKSGELVDTGTTVIIVSNDLPVIEIGVTPEDLVNLKQGMTAVAEFQGNNYQGFISSITGYPDSYTNTYQVKISLVESDLALLPPIGAIIKICIPLNDIDGVFLPITLIESDGEDFVYIKKGDRAYKNYISIDEIFNDYVLVFNLEPGTSLITSGSKSLRDGALINEID